MPDLDKTAFVFIEFQNDWIAPDGKINHLMQDRAHFEAAVAGGRRLLAVGRSIGARIAHCGLSYQPGHPELGSDGWGLRGVIPKVTTFTRGSYGAAFAPDFEPGEGEFVVQGRTGGSGFAGSNLDVFLRNSRIRHLVLAGFATNVCVSSTMRAAHDLGYNVTVAEDACACFTREQHDFEIKHVVHHFGHHATVGEIERQFLRNAA
jgi:nicotinamidase-related amidase